MLAQIPTEIFLIVVSAALGVIIALMGWFAKLVVSIDRRLGKVETFLTLWIKLEQKKEIEFDADKS